MGKPINAYITIQPSSGLETGFWFPDSLHFSIVLEIETCYDTNDLMDIGVDPRGLLSGKMNRVFWGLVVFCQILYLNEEFYLIINYAIFTEGSSSTSFEDKHVYKNINKYKNY